MKKRISKNKIAGTAMLLLFIGSMVGIAIEYGAGRQASKIPDENIIRQQLTDAQVYGILSNGFPLLRLSVPVDCGFFCQKDVKAVEDVVNKYTPYVYLVEISTGTTMRLVTETYAGEEEIENITPGSVEESICDAIPFHEFCRRIKAISAIDDANNETNPMNMSLL
ncbi:MAG: hypothetical protein KAJ24_00160 [Candidatus Aenigmarchaeota archaeon]|nr:hypothetical protein [Candidatus Aenigmarchaeota archaeon]